MAIYIYINISIYGICVLPLPFILETKTNMFLKYVFFVILSCLPVRRFLKKALTQAFATATVDIILFIYLFIYFFIF